MRLLKVIALIATVSAMAACSTAPNCEELAPYELAEGGKRIDAPDDLSKLPIDKEMSIPEASPRPPRERTAACLDRPPTLRINDEEDEDDEEDEVEEEA
jgi:hypothetical protein